MKKRRLKKTGIVILLMTLISITILVFSLIKILNWYKDSKNTKEITKEAIEKVEIEEIKEEDEENVQIIEPSEEIIESNPYWDYIKMSLINVDFSELENINQDTVGWIQVNGTNINYPFVQASDNSFYLNHSFDKSYNEAGWVFLDYRNDINNLNKNTILYAHGRVDRVMFSSLKDILKSTWYDNLDNHVIKLSTKTHNTLWQVFSVYHIETTNDYIKTKFQTDEEFAEFVKVLQDRSMYKFQTSVTGTDKILTLSTCYNNDEKMVMHAKLIKYAEK